MLDWAYEHFASELITSDDVLADLDDDERADLDLANALLAVEREHQARQCEAVEALLALIPPGGDIGEVLHLPRPLAMQAMRWSSPALPDTLELSCEA